MYSEVSWLSGAAAVQNLLHYCRDKSHRDHRDKTIGREITRNVLAGRSPLEMMLNHIAECDARNRKIRRGRKIKRKIQHTIERTPDGAWLTEGECEWFQQEVLTRMEWDFGISFSHTDRLTGATDFHFVAPYRKGPSNPIARLRAVSDEIHAELNQKRRERAAPRIETIPEARFRKRKEAGIKSLAEQLAGVDDLDASKLRAHVEGLGHTVTRFNADKGTISVVHQGKKKAHRYSIENLLAEAGPLRALKGIPLPAVDLATPDVNLS
jgi:hypothetical protein